MKMNKKLTIDEVDVLLYHYFAAKEIAEEAVKEFITRADEPLETRWKMFVDSKLGNSPGFIQNFDSLEGGKWDSWSGSPIINKFYKYRETKGITITAVEMLEELTGYVGNSFKIVDCYENLGKPEWIEFTWEDLYLFQEEVLSKFIKSFCYDW